MRRILFTVAAFLAFSGNVYASYDDSWYQTEFWSGEWPPGFSVIHAGGVKVPARVAMNKDIPATIQCELPFKAVFHPWNEIRNQKSSAHYWTASKTVNLVANEDFVFVSEEGQSVQIRKGDTVRYLVYGSEGSFLVEIENIEYVADQSFFEHFDSVPPSAFVEDRWVQLNCEDRQMAWILMTDLYDYKKDRYLPGIADAGRGIRSYGVAEDLRDSDINKD